MHAYVVVDCKRFYFWALQIWPIWILFVSPEMRQQDVSGPNLVYWPGYATNTLYKQLCDLKSRHLGSITANYFCFSKCTMRVVWYSNSELDEKTLRKGPFSTKIYYATFVQKRIVVWSNLLTTTRGNKIFPFNKRLLQQLKYRNTAFSQKPKFTGGTTTARQAIMENSKSCQCANKGVLPE